MGGLLPWYSLAIVTTLLNGSTLGFIGWRERAPALKLWAAAWLAWGLAVIPLVALGTPQERPLLGVLCGMLWVVSALLFLRGAYQLVERRAPRAWLVVAGGCVLLALGLGVGPAGPAGMIPLVVFQSLGLVATGVVIVRADRGRAGAWLCGIALIGMGLHVLDAPFFANRPGMFAWGFVLAIALQLLTAVGMLMLHYEHARAQLIEAQRVVEENRRIEALGRIAGGVAHDFNNMLTVMQGYLDLTQVDSDSRADIKISWEAIQGAVERAGRLTKQLLAFGQRSVLQPHAIDVRVVAEGLLDLLKKVIPENIELDLRSGEGSYLASMDPTLLEQIILNLVTNARDAITGHGHIGVELARRDGPPPELIVRVVDDGAGMDEELMKRVFEPFFSSKPVGRGTGLGLASVQGAVSQLGGQVSVRSKVGSGSTFEVILPWIAAGPASAAKPIDGTATRALNILVVDDDESVREVTARMLLRGGHKVEQAADGERALQLIRAKTYDLLISDLVMPRLGGVDLSDEARKLRPDMAMLVVSGHPLDGQPSTARTKFLPKPYGPNELLSHVARIAETGPNGGPRG